MRDADGAGTRTFVFANSDSAKSSIGRERLSAHAGIPATQESQSSSMEICDALELAGERIIRIGEMHAHLTFRASEPGLVDFSVYLGASASRWSIAIGRAGAGAGGRGNRGSGQLETERRDPARTDRGRGS